MDEFYGGYNYTSNCDGTTVSAAENIVDVDEDDVLLVRKFVTHFHWGANWHVFKPRAGHGKKRLTPKINAD